MLDIEGWPSQGFFSCGRFAELANQLMGQGMAGAVSDNSCLQGPAQQGQISEEVDNLMADEFVGEAELVADGLAVGGDDQDVGMCKMGSDPLLATLLDFRLKKKGSGPG